MDTGVEFADDGAGADIAFDGTGFEWQGGVLSGTWTNVALLRLTTAGLKRPQHGSAPR